MANGDISVATFNLYNLNAAGRAVYSDRDGWTAEQAAAKVRWTGAMLSRLGADVWGFQELWHPEPLQAAFAGAGLGQGYDLLVPPDADGTRIVCAGAVRRGWLHGAPEWITRFPDGFRLESAGDDPQTPGIQVRLTGCSRPVLHFAVRPRADRPPIHV